MSIRWLVVLLAGLVLVTSQRAAEACGVWKMTDQEKKLDISWLINAGTIKKGKRRVAALYLDAESEHAPRVVAGKRVVFDVVGGKLRKRGKPIATLDGSTLTFGKRVYTIELGNPSDYHGMPAWSITVKRGDDVIVTAAQAAALCVPMHRDPPMSEADQQAEITKRVAFYLAWRETGL